MKFRILLCSIFRKWDRIYKAYKFKKNNNKLGRPNTVIAIDNIGQRYSPAQKSKHFSFFNSWSNGHKKASPSLKWRCFGRKTTKKNIATCNLRLATTHRALSCMLRFLKLLTCSLKPMLSLQALQCICSKSTCSARLASQKFGSKSKKHHASVIYFAHFTVQLTVVIRPPHIFSFFLPTKPLKSKTQ